MVLGVLIALLPVLGFPRAWEIVFQVFAGIAIVLVSVWSTIDKKIMLKHKAQQRAARKTETTSPEVSKFEEMAHSFGKRVTDFYPKTAPPGRRLSDINPTINPDSEESKN